MQLTFQIDDKYLIAHALASMGPGAFFASENNATVVDMQNGAWRISPAAYDLLAGRLTPQGIANIERVVGQLPAFFLAVMQSAPFRKLREETEHYRASCAEQWDRNRERSTQIIHDLTGFDLNRSFVVFVTHPSLKNGRILDDHHLAWGHHEEWPDYTTVHLWHEILHAYFDRNDTTHAIIQLIADNELRTQLSGGTYPPFIGHPHLFLRMEHVLPQWREYLTIKPPRDIAAFRSAMDV